MSKKYLAPLMLSCALLSGCGYQVAKLQNYEPGIDLSQRALLVVRINNIDYLDIRRVEDGIVVPEVIPAQPQAVAQASVTKEELPAVQGYDLRKLFNQKKTKNNEATQLSFTPSEYRIIKHTFMLKPFSYTQALYTIEPGTYYISVAGIDSEQCIYYTEAPGVNKDGVIAYGAFQIKPGEILYLGDIECQWRSSNAVKKFLVHDKLTAVKKDLQEAGYSEFASKLSSAKFYPKGSNLHSIN